MSDHIRRDDSFVEIISTAVRLAVAGFHGVPRVAARHLTGFGEFDNFLRCTRYDGGVNQLVLFRDDRNKTSSRHRPSIGLMGAGVFKKYGLQTIGVADFSEDRPKISRSTFDAPRALKFTGLDRNEVEPYFITQVCLDAATIVGWVERICRRSIIASVGVALLGLVGIITLSKFSVGYGTDGSIRAYARRHDGFWTEARLEKIIAALCRLEFGRLRRLGCIA